MPYRVKTVASMTGIPRPTLVAWERRYGMLEPRRDESGYRVYSDADVALLQRLKAMVDSGMAISEALRVAGAGTPAIPAPVVEPPARAPILPWRRLVRALLTYDRTAAELLLRDLEHYSFERCIDDLYQPLLTDLGEAWQAGRITIAQEHYASGFCREQLLGMFHRLGAGPENGIPVACATVPGEPHDLGLLCVAIRLALRGCRVTWLGADVPIEDLSAFLSTHPPRLLCLSTVLPQPGFDVLDFARRVQRSARPRTLVAVGGPGTRGLEHESTDRCWFCPEVEDFWARWMEALTDGRGVA